MARRRGWHGAIMARPCRGRNAKDRTNSARCLKAVDTHRVGHMGEAVALQQAGEAGKDIMRHERSLVDERSEKLTPRTAQRSDQRRGGKEGAKTVESRLYPSD